MFFLLLHLCCPAFSNGLGVVCKGNLNGRLALLVKMHNFSCELGKEAEVKHEQFAALWSSLSDLFTDDPAYESAFNECIAVAVQLANQTEDVVRQPSFSAIPGEKSITSTDTASTVAADEALEEHSQANLSGSAGRAESPGDHRQSASEWSRTSLDFLDQDSGAFMNSSGGLTFKILRAAVLTQPRKGLSFSSSFLLSPLYRCSSGVSLLSLLHLSFFSSV